MRANVLFPTATLPAMPMTNGIGRGRVPRNVSVDLCSVCVAATCRLRSRDSGR